MPVATNFPVPLYTEFTSSLKRTPTKAPLEKWLQNNQHDPYPSKDDKIKLSLESNMSVTQICNWFANSRRKLKESQDGLKNDQQEAEKETVSKRKREKKRKMDIEEAPAPKAPKTNQPTAFIDYSQMLPHQVHPHQYMYPYFHMDPLSMVSMSPYLPTIPMPKYDLIESLPATPPKTPTSGRSTVTSIKCEQSSESPESPSRLSPCSTRSSRSSTPKSSNRLKIWSIEDILK